MTTPTNREGVSIKPTRYSFDVGYDNPLSRYDLCWTGKGWAIIGIGERLTRTGKWIYQPQPSSRSDYFIKRTTFTLEEGLKMFGKLPSILRESYD